MRSGDISTLERKFGIDIVKVVEYRPVEFLPRLKYLQDALGDWYHYSVSIQSQIFVEKQDIRDWICSEHNLEDYKFTLGDKVTDQWLINELNSEEEL